MVAQPATKRHETDAAPQKSADLHLMWSTLALGSGNQALGELARTRVARSVSGIYLVFLDGPSGTECLLADSARDIGGRLNAHSNDPRVLPHAWSGTLRVVWAPVATIHCPGILSYLTGALSPRARGAKSCARPVAVNLPR